MIFGIDDSEIDIEGCPHTLLAAIGVRNPETLESMTACSCECTLSTSAPAIGDGDSLRRYRLNSIGSSMIDSSNSKWIVSSLARDEQAARKSRICRADACAAWFLSRPSVITTRGTES